MMVTHKITFRLYPSIAIAATLHYHRRLHKELYNACVYHRKAEYQKFGKFVTYFDQQNCLPAFKKFWDAYKDINSQAFQATVKRVDYAFQRFLVACLRIPDSSLFIIIRDGHIQPKVVGVLILWG